jgi:hypothetical protein
MLAESFRLGAGHLVPAGGRGKRALRALATLALALIVAPILTSCGGSGAKERLVDGNGFTFMAPSSWHETRRATMITVSPGKDDPELVGVSIFRLVNPYRPALFPRVVPELNGVAVKLAGELRGRVTGRRNVTVAGLKARQYELAYARGGVSFRQTITFVLEDNREYQLICRRSADAELAACARLLRTFRIAA